MQKTREVKISDNAYKRVKAFKQVIEAVIEEERDLDNCIEVILDRGIDLMLQELIGNVEADVLLKSIQQLGSKYPVEVYGHIAETIRKGAAINRQEMRKTLGFQFETEDKNSE